MRYDFTRTGIRRLGDFTREYMDDAGLSMPKLVEQCDRVGYSTNVPKIQRLRDGVGMEPPVGLLWAMARLKLIQHADGTPYTLEDFLLIACEQCNPYEEMGRAAEASGNYTAFPERSLFLNSKCATLAWKPLPVPANFPSAICEISCKGESPPLPN
ncbi:MAG: hypothetical protein HC772_20070 [Leptolyngbyaceae cyanobacterium CRU_2_3]|nr:hypothetical protein [Leptolyngbyaceae cyanobacterium CRU_2_3]